MDGTKQKAMSSPVPEMIGLHLGQDRKSFTLSYSSSRCLIDAGGTGCPPVPDTGRRREQSQLPAYVVISVGGIRVVVAPAFSLTSRKNKENVAIRIAAR